MTRECASDQEMYEIMLAIIACSPYAKVIDRKTRKGEDQDLIALAWQMSLAEEQGFEPITSHESENISFSILFSKKSPFTGYIPIYSISEH